MDAVSYSLASKQAQRIKKIIANPDSTSGIVTVPKTIASGETITIPNGRVAVLPNVVVDGDLVVEAGGEIFVPAGANFSDLENQIALKADTSYVNNKYSGFKNYIINGGFNIWQRGESFSSNSPAFFTADRWMLDSAGVASGLSASKQPGLVGKNSLYIIKTSGAYMQVYQMVENQGNLSNKTFTFSALVKSSNNGTINFKIVDGRAGTNFIYNQTPVALEAHIPKEIVFTAQLGQVSADALFVGIVTTCSDLFLDRVQMEEGSVATPFEQRPIGLELSLCQRYYRKSFDINITPSNAGSSDTINDIVNAITTTAPHRSQLVSNMNTCSIPFGVEMRIKPTIQRYGNSSGYWFFRDSTMSRFDTNIHILATTKGLIIANEVSTDLNVFVVGHYTADAEL